MRAAALIVTCLFVSPALAYDIKGLSQQDMLLIGEALDAMPHGKVAALYARIQQQITTENQAASIAERARVEKEIRDQINTESKKDKPNE